MSVVKTGYVGVLLDGKELHSSQYGVRHYRKVIETAAKHKIMIDIAKPQVIFSRTSVVFLTPIN